MSVRQPMMRSLLLIGTLVAAGLLFWPACDTCNRRSDPCCGDPCCGDPNCGSTTACTDSCCGDPCCGDPCCGDPCCGDPCCGDPCCGDCSLDTTNLAVKAHGRFSSIKDRASYNLVCSADRITLNTNAEGSIAALGCGKTTTYRCACIGGSSSLCETPTCRAAAAAPKPAPVE
jgi:hypothetical protein